MTKKGFSVLQSLILNQESEIIAFICIGRDSNLDNDFSLDIEKLCQENNLTFYFKDSNIIKEKESHYYIAVSWRWLIEKPNLIILHDSILPKYRGFAPLVNMLINGENELGVTAIFASNEYDKGDIILQETIKVDYPMKIAEAINKISELYIIIVLRLFNLISEKQKLIGVKQDEEKASYCLWLDNEDYFIDWNISAEKIKRKIDACSSPYKGAKCWLNNEVVIINDASVDDDVKIENRETGKVIFVKNSDPVVVCGTGLLRIKNAFTEKDFRNILPLSKFRTRFK